MRKTVAVLLTVLTLALLTVTAGAAATPELHKSGAITVTLMGQSRGGVAAPLSGAELTVYQVASAELDGQQLVYCPMAGLEDYREDMNGLLTASGTRRLARSLALEHRALARLAAECAETDERGEASFSDLTPGLYLVLQTAPNAGYRDMESLLLFVPQWNWETERWDYDLEAAPKTEPGKPGKPGTDPEPEPPTTPPLDPDPDITEGEKPGGDKLPQTGVSRWPVFALALGGMLLFTAGWSLERKEKKNHEKK